MPFSILPMQKLFIFTLICTATFLFSSGFAQENPAQMAANAFFCFNNKFIYNACDEAYRLNPSGSITVPGEAADIFCDGPCLAETQKVLKCVSNILVNFIFSNKATIPEVRYALNAGCSHTSQRGNFNVGDYIGEANAHRQPNLIGFHTVILIVACCFYLI